MKFPTAKLIIFTEVFVFLRIKIIGTNMIFYFSGTGNSRHVAERIGLLIGEDYVENIADHYFHVLCNKDYSIDVDENEALGFVCPVHSWGIAKSMARFLKKTRINYRGSKIFAILVCGDTCGKAREQLQEALWKRSRLRCDFVCSVQMPNTYIVMKGFGTDPDELAAQKLANAEKQLDEIADAINNNKPYDHYVVGSHPFLKGRIVYPLFMAFTLGDRKFHADSNCISCGQCVDNCPEHNIHLDAQNRPVWLGHCVKCLSCIHRCPKKAIQYGDITQTMGRYFYKKLK